MTRVVEMVRRVMLIHVDMMLMMPHVMLVMRTGYRRGLHGSR